MIPLLRLSRQKKKEAKGTLFLKNNSISIQKTRIRPAIWEKSCLEAKDSDADQVYPLKVCMYISRFLLYKQFILICNLIANCS